MLTLHVFKQDSSIRKDKCGPRAIHQGTRKTKQSMWKGKLTQREGDKAPHRCYPVPPPHPHPCAGFPAPLWISVTCLFHPVASLFPTLTTLVPKCLEWAGSLKFTALERQCGLGAKESFVQGHPEIWGTVAELEINFIFFLFQQSESHSSEGHLCLDDPTSGHRVAFGLSLLLCLQSYLLNSLSLFIIFFSLFYI